MKNHNKSIDKKILIKQYDFLMILSNYLDNIALEQKNNKFLLEELKIDQYNILNQIKQINKKINI